MTIRLGLVLVMTLALAGCDGSSVTRGINSLGLGFVRAFNAQPNNDPVDPDTIDLKVDPTGEPFDV